ncbi:MAG TPA: hypothetical protein VLF88_01820, partial [Candidatus Babeliales bacterium]|nr:hypothetical protein [Candidatus Babeliales bacterium]
MAKEVKKRPAKTVPSDGRVRKLTRKQEKAKAKQEARLQKPIIGSFRLTWRVFGIIKQYWRALGGIVLVYLLLNIIF